MKIVSWNCNGAFRRKFDRIAGLNADVFVIQECEDPAKSSSDYQDWAGSYLWAGGSTHKGIGIFAKNGLTIKPLDWESHELKQFLPVNIGDRINILAVWTKHAPVMRYVGQFWQYLNHHKALFDHDLIICGDFNSNSNWDRKGRVWNHSECVDALAQIGFQSVYHYASGEKQGKESEPTFYLQRNLAKPYHIDYFFAHAETLASCSPEMVLGQATDWLSISDHMPITLQF